MVDDGKQNGGFDIIQITVAIIIVLLFKLLMRSWFPAELEIETH
jgi:hypothetical protein